jgi:putative Mg2+ transporter-C (MgtC) family protein
MMFDMTLPIHEVVIRIFLAIFSGTVLGLNRWMHHKSAGVRTHSLVALGSALAILVMQGMIGGDAQAQSHVLQGILSGIGFLGAGVIIHRGVNDSVKGLTTAASIWVCAVMGVSFGAGQITLGMIGLAGIFVVLLLGGPLEKLTNRLMQTNQSSENSSTKDE